MPTKVSRNIVIFCFGGNGIIMIHLGMGVCVCANKTPKIGSPSNSFCWI